MSPVIGSTSPAWANSNVSTPIEHNEQQNNTVLYSRGYISAKHADQLLSERLSTIASSFIPTNVEYTGSEHNDKVNGNDFEWVRAPNIHARLEYLG